jgi:hypothetical protein
MCFKVAPCVLRCLERYSRMCSIRLWCKWCCQGAGSWRLGNEHRNGAMPQARGASRLHHRSCVSLAGRHRWGMKFHHLAQQMGTQHRRVCATHCCTARSHLEDAPARLIASGAGMNKLHTSSPATCHTGTSWGEMEFSCASADALRRRVVVISYGWFALWREIAVLTLRGACPNGAYLDYYWRWSDERST